MHILAIETSCDETGIAIVDTHTNGDKALVTILAETLLSQAEKHAEYGGVYPSLAKREHAKNLVPLFTEALQQAQMFERAERPEVSKEVLEEIKELLEREPELFAHLVILLAQLKKPSIDAIAVTNGPGLEPALWVGVNFARALSLAWGIPLIPTNHMEGHIAAALAEGEDSTYNMYTPSFPALALLISGGHTELVHIPKWKEYEKIGSTRDDAVGEAFDKSARLLGLPYPGGPEISALALAAREEGLEQVYSLPRPMLTTDDLNFSFSGLKTAVRNLVQSIGTPTPEQRKLVARELEDAITEVLVAKTKRALELHGAKTLIVSGGVAANTHIRKALEELVSEFPEATVHFPLRRLSTDNGVMIALAASFHTPTKDTNISANAHLSLDGTNRKEGKKQ